MKPYSLYLLAAFLLLGSAFGAEPYRTGTVQAQIQAELGQKQALADTLWAYLRAEPARHGQLDEAANRLYGLAFREDGMAEKLPNAASLGLASWQEALAPLRKLDLPPAAAASLKALEQVLKEAARVLSVLPTVAADSPKQRIERQQALLAAASALGALKQQAVALDGQLQEEARRAASGAHLLATQGLMLPAANKGEKP